MRHELTRVLAEVVGPRAYAVPAFQYADASDARVVAAAKVRCLEPLDTATCPGLQAAVVVRIALDGTSTAFELGAAVMAAVLAKAARAAIPICMLQISAAAGTT